MSPLANTFASGSYVKNNKIQKTQEKFIALSIFSSQATAYSSTDASSWNVINSSSYSPSGSNVPEFKCGIYGNSSYAFIPYNGSRVYRSTDNGITWNVPAIKNPDGSFLSVSTFSRNIAYGNNIYLATMEYDNQNFICSVDNGNSWNIKSFSQTITCGSNNSIAYGNNKFLVIGTDSTYVYNSQGIDVWVKTSLPSGINQGVICFAEDRFVLVRKNFNSNDYTAYSFDGINWTYGGAQPSSNMWRTIIYGQGKIIVATNSNSYLISTDKGITWSSQMLPESIDLQFGTYSNGKFLISSKTRALYSSDGYNWTAYQIAGVNGVFTELGAIA